MFPIFTFAEMKDVRGLIRSDFGPNEGNNFFCDYTSFRGCQAPSKFDAGNFLENLHIFLTERDRVVGGTKICRMIDFLSVLNTLLSSNYNRNQGILKNVVF